MSQNKGLRLLTYVIIAYMILTFLWWATLLFIKNETAYSAQADAQRVELMTSGEISTVAEYEQTEYYKSLRRKYKQQEWMILTQAAAFVVSLVIGVWLINRAYVREVEAARQQRNFLLSITHELKSPIASIKLVLETMLRRILRKEQYDKLARAALQEAERLNELVANLLMAAKVETAYEPTMMELDVEVIVDNILLTMNEKFPDVKFSLDKTGDIPHIEADEFGFISVLINLVENAVKYSPGDTEINISMRTDNRSIFIDVADNGVGISDANKAQVFEKFYRVGNEDTRQTKGTGLGLFIVKQIIEAHNGDVEIRDNHPRGTIFSVCVPISQDAFINAAA